MQFFELEKIMAQCGITTLADIARVLNTTPQEVSNWKDSNNVPSYIITKLEKIMFAGNSPSENSKSSIHNTFSNASLMFDEDTTSISIFKTLSTMVEQLKVILLVTFITTFLVFTYVQFFQQPQYRSWASVFLKSYREDMNQGVIIAPSLLLYPEFLRTRRFTEKILDKEFHTDKFGKKLPLLAILTHGDEPSKLERNILVRQATGTLNSTYLKISKGVRPEILIISVTAPEPKFAKELVEAVLVELRALHHSYAEDIISSRRGFIERQLAAYEEGEGTEKIIDKFHARNRELLTPSLQRELDHYKREADYKKDFYLYLKRQQSELAYAKDDLQGRSVMEIIDSPAYSLSPSNMDLKRNILIAGVLGVGLGVLIGFARSYLCNNGIDARKRLGHLIKKKIKDVILDWRVSGIVSIFLLAGSPFYLGRESGHIMTIGRSSSAIMIVYTTYIMAILTSICISIYLYRKNIR